MSRNMCTASTRTCSQPAKLVVGCTHGIIVTRRIVTCDKSYTRITPASLAPSPVGRELAEPRSAEGSGQSLSHDMANMCRGLSDARRAVSSDSNQFTSFASLACNEQWKGRQIYIPRGHTRAPKALALGTLWLAVPAMSAF